MQSLPRNRALEWALFVLTVLACLVLLMHLSPVFASLWGVIKVVAAPFLIAMVISYTLNPVVSALVKRGVPRGMSVVIIYLVFLAVMAIIILNALPSFIEQMKTFADQLPRLVDQADRWLNSLTDGTQYLPVAVRQAVEDNLAKLEQSTVRSISDFLGYMGQSVDQILMAFVIPFLVFYMLKDLKLMERAVITWFPSRYRAEWIGMLHSIDSALGAYIRGQFLVMIAVGILTYAGYLVVGLPFALAMATLVAVLNVIPYIGGFLGAAPSVLFALILSPKLAIKVVIVNLIVQQIEGNILSPAIVGKTLNLHPLTIILALLIGGEVGGIMGLIFCIPLVAVLKVIFQHVTLHYVRR
ncbi:MAG: family transporter [Bacilli bacterium]|nr:family transporter [Bacilli bacterium]